MAYARKISSHETPDLSSVDPKHHDGLDKAIGEAATETLGEELLALQALMYEAGQHSLLVVLQGRDTSGKDGTIRCLAKFMNMQACRVASFKVPTAEEAGHDFLWRVHKETPRNGMGTIFNRSHYEDVLIVRVHKLVPKETWEARYDEINAFEKLLTRAGTIVVKFYLHISKDEQEQRLLDREKDTEKAWKLSVGDWKERELWADYTAAYQDAIGKCSTKEAPWYIVPADHKWFRNLCVVETLVETLKPYKKEWLERLEEIGKQAKKDLAEFRKGQATE